MMDQPHSRERSFGLSVGSVCGLVAAYAVWRHRETVAIGWAAVSAVLLIPAMVKPSSLRIPCALWWRFAHALGWINTRVLLLVLFFAIFAPIGVVMRLFGWDPLQRRGASRSTNWLPYPQRMRDPHHYERMY